jgi:hypothetical protein
MYVHLAIDSKNKFCKLLHTRRDDLQGFDFLPERIIKKVAPNVHVQRLLRKHIVESPEIFSWRRKLWAWKTHRGFLRLVKACEALEVKMRSLLVA